MYVDMLRKFVKSKACLSLPSACRWAKLLRTEICSVRPFPTFSVVICPIIAFLCYLVSLGLFLTNITKVRHKNLNSSQKFEFVTKIRQKPKKLKETKGNQVTTNLQRSKKNASIFICTISVLRSSARPQADGELKNSNSTSQNFDQIVANYGMKKTRHSHLRKGLHHLTWMKQETYQSIA